MQGKKFLSCCDSELLGKTFTEGKCCLRITEGFYKGTEISLDEASDVIAENIETMDSIQIIGEHIISHLHDCELISKEGARRTCNVPHLILIRT
ncbi:MAG: DUF424 family protein [Candidatus Sigynarchaeota archaeon]